MLVMTDAVMLRFLCRLCNKSDIYIQFRNCLFVQVIDVVDVMLYFVTSLHIYLWMQ